MFYFLKKHRSGQSAKKRLQTVISRDRANVSAEFLSRLSEEIIQTVKKYIEPQDNGITITIDRNGAGTCLCTKFNIKAYKQLT